MKGRRIRILVGLLLVALAVFLYVYYVSAIAPAGINRAARDGDVTRVTRILAVAPWLVNAETPDFAMNPSWIWARWRPLHWAASEGRKDVAELLLAKGADVNAREDMGLTPLHCAANGGHKDMAELLLAKGADVNAIGFRGTPLHWAAATHHSSVEATVRNWGGNEGRKDVAELLLANGADVNV